MSRISWNKPIGKRKANSSRLAIGWRSPKGICKLSSKPGNPHLVVLLVGKSVFPRWRKMMSWPRPFNCRARLPTVYGTPPIVSSPEVTSRILTVIQKFGELIRILIHHREQRSQRFIISNSPLHVLGASAVSFPSPSSPQSPRAPEPQSEQQALFHHGGTGREKKSPFALRRAQDERLST